MIKEFVEAWDAYKDRLKSYFKYFDQQEYNTYEKLVKLLFMNVINPYLEDLETLPLNRRI